MIDHNVVAYSRFSKHANRKRKQIQFSAISLLHKIGFDHPLNSAKQIPTAYTGLHRGLHAVAPLGAEVRATGVEALAGSHYCT